MKLYDKVRYKVPRYLTSLEIFEVMDDKVKYKVGT